MENIKNIAIALLKAQSEMSNPIKGNSNLYFKSKYADLNAVREAVIPVLNRHGITVLQPMINIEGRNFVKTTLLHESGEEIESLTEIVYTKTNDAQAQGSGITYARRYGLQSLVCVGADDDDGNKASYISQEKAPVQKQFSPGEDISSVKESLLLITSINDLKNYWDQITHLQGNNEVKKIFNERKKQLTA